MFAGWADLGGFFALVDVATVAAFPVNLVFAFKVAILDDICQGFVAQVVPLFYFGDFFEGLSNFIKAFFLGNLSGVFVEQGKFFVLTSSSGFKVLPGGTHRRGIICIYMNHGCTKMPHDVIVKKSWHVLVRCQQSL